MKYLPFIILCVCSVCLYNCASISAQDSNTTDKPARDYILIGHPNPSTGDLALFGAVSPWTNDRLVSWINKHGGIYIKEYGKKLPVKVKMVDTESDPTKAIKVTVDLIVRDKADMIVAMHTSETVNSASAVCEKYGVPCISNQSPVETWLTNGPYKWSYHSCWSLDLVADVYMGMMDEHAEQTDKVVGCLWPDSADGIAFKEVFEKKLSAHGYTVVTYSGFPSMTKDFSPAIKLFKSKNAEIITCLMNSGNLITFWQQCQQMKYCPKMAAMPKAAHLLSTEGEIPDGFIGGVWWSPYHPFKSALTGENCEEICRAWTNETGKEWTMALGYGYAVFEVALDALIRAQSLDKEKIRQAIETTDLDTVIGHIKYNEQHYCITSLVGGQWARGSDGQWRVTIIYNKQYPEIPKTGEMVFPLPNGN